MPFPKDKTFEVPQDAMLTHYDCHFLTGHALGLIAAQLHVVGEVEILNSL